MTKCLAAIFGLVLITFAMSGCSTLTESPAERLHAAGRTEEYNAYMFNEEFDEFWLIDHPSRLSKWMIR